MTKEEVIAIIEEYNSKNKASFNVQNHRHNGSDANKVLMGDLAYDNRGLIFPTNNGNTIFQSTYDDLNEINNFLLYPTTNLNTFLNVGGSGNMFYGMNFGVFNQAYTVHQEFDGNDAYLPYVGITEMILTGDGLTLGSTFETNASVGFRMRLPDNTNLPPSPQVGEICIYNGILQVCEVAGVWTPK